MGFSDKIKNFISQEEDDDKTEQLNLSSEDADAVSPYEKNGSSITADTNIALFEPRNFDEATEIGHHIKNNKACCLNLHRLPSEYRQRIIDFLSGVVYGVDGSIKRIGENVILCSPKNLQVGGNINLNSEEEDY